MMYARDTRFKNFGIGAIAAFLSLTIVGIVGWVLNIIALVGMTFAGHELMAVVRVIGLFIPPVGAVAGYL